MGYLLSHIPTSDYLSSAVKMKSWQQKEEQCQISPTTFPYLHHQMRGYWSLQTRSPAPPLLPEHLLYLKQGAVAALLLALTHLFNRTCCAGPKWLWQLQSDPRRSSLNPSARQDHHTPFCYCHYGAPYPLCCWQGNDGVWGVLRLREVKQQESNAKKKWISVLKKELDNKSVER